MKRIISFLLCAVLLVISASSLISCDANSRDYDKALALIEEKKYEEAMAIFEALGDYKDSEKHLSRFYFLPYEQAYSLKDRSGVIYTTYGENNLPVKMNSSNQLKTTETCYTYDSNGRLLKQHVTQSDNGGDPYVHYIDYTYDEKGNLTSLVYTNKDGEVGYTNTYTHYENGWLKTESSTTPADGLLYTITYTYDEEGKLLKDEYVSGDYVATSTYTYENGNRTEILYTYTGSDDSHCYYTNDEKGRVVKKEYVNGDEIYTCTFTYDDYDNVLNETHIHSDETVESADNKYILVYIPLDVPAGTDYLLENLFVVF